MNVIQGIAAAAAVAVAAAPHLRQVVSWLSIKGDVKPEYQASVASLASVRLRLKATDRLGDEQRAAINVLTLALVDGSDQ